MRIVFSVNNNNGIESEVSAHFGKCPYFLVIDVEESGAVKNTEAVSNPYFSGHSPGVVPEFIAELGADIMISGGMGPKAIEYFEKLNIKVFTGAQGSVKSNLAKFLENKLSSASPCSSEENDKIC